MQTPARAEYVARINRVMDHIDGHLGDPLTLDELAAVAAPRKPVTEVALDCGVSGSAPFARAFKETLGMSASEWRRTMGPRA